MDKIVTSFIEVRNYISSTVATKVEVYLTGIWDVFVKHTVIKETVNIIEREVMELYPDFPSKHLPKCRFRIFEEDMEIEAGIQNYFNHESELIFLGTSNLGDELFDCYYRISYDPQFDYVFISKYGHDENEYYIGSKTAKAEYYLGQYTPLSIAYGLAIEDGFIR